MPSGRPLRARRLGDIARLPVAEQLLDVVAQPLPIEIARDGQDRAARPIVLRMKLAHVVDRRRAQRRLLRRGSIGPTDRDTAAGAARSSACGSAHRRSPATPAGTCCGPLRADRPANAAGATNRQTSSSAGRQIVAQRRAVKRRLRHADRFAPLDAQVLELRNPGPAIARPGPAQHHLAGQRRQPGPLRRIVAAPGRQQKRERRRLQRLSSARRPAPCRWQCMRKYFSGHALLWIARSVEHTRPANASQICGESRGTRPTLPTQLAALAASRIGQFDRLEQRLRAAEAEPLVEPHRPSFCAVTSR